MARVLEEKSIHTLYTNSIAISPHAKQVDPTNGDMVIASAAGKNILVNDVNLLAALERRAKQRPKLFRRHWTSK